MIITLIRTHLRFTYVFQKSDSALQRSLEQFPVEVVESSEEVSIHFDPLQSNAMSKSHLAVVSGHFPEHFYEQELNMLVVIGSTNVHKHAHSLLFQPQLIMKDAFHAAGSFHSSSTTIRQHEFDGKPSFPEPGVKAERSWRFQTRDGVSTQECPRSSV